MTLNESKHGWCTSKKSSMNYPLGYQTDAGWMALDSPFVLRITINLSITLGGGETHNLYQKDNPFIIIKAMSRLCWGRQKDNPFVDHKRRELVGQLDDVACLWSCNLTHVTWKRNYRNFFLNLFSMAEYNIQTHGFNCPWILETSLCCPCCPCQTRAGVLVFEKKKREVKKL